MKNLIKITLLILAVLLSPLLVWADTEDIECDGTTPPNDWFNQGGLDKCDNVSDEVDNNFIYANVDETKQRLTMANPTVVTGDDTIDSVKIMWRGIDDGTGPNNAQMHQYVDANSNDGADVSLTTSWVDYEDNFALAPDGSSWDMTDLNDLQLEAHCTSLGGGHLVGVTRLYARIYYTVGGDGDDISYTRRIKIIKGE